MGRHRNPPPIAGNLFHPARCYARLKPSSPKPVSELSEFLVGRLPASDPHVFSSLVRVPGGNAIADHFLRAEIGVVQIVCVALRAVDATPSEANKHHRLPCKVSFALNRPEDTLWSQRYHASPIEPAGRCLGSNPAVSSGTAADLNRQVWKVTGKLLSKPLHRNRR